MKKPRVSLLRYLVTQIYRLLLLGSPIWIFLLAVNFPAPVSTVAVPVFCGVCAIVGATAIFLLVRRLNRGHDKPLSDRPPGAVRPISIQEIRSKLRSIRES